MRALFLLLISLLLGLQYKLWLGEGGIIAVHILNHKIYAQKQHNSYVEKHNNALAADISELRSVDQALEEQARYELGFIKQNEIFYQIIRHH